jgi:hypothetical protein
MAEVVTNLNLTDISAERRSTVLTGLAESATELLQERFPASEGYVHRTATFAPFKERPNLRGHRIWVWRGQLWGYRVMLVPADFQSRTVRITLAGFQRLTEHLAVCAAIPAMVLLAGLLIYGLANWGTWKDYRDPVLLMLAAPLGLGLALFGTLWGLSRPFVALKTDRQRIKEEMTVLRQDLHDALVAPASHRAKQAIG